jgi:predicted metal-dependent phosphoesterase TrpH
VRVDFHVHTVHSKDSVITFQALVEGCIEKGIDAVAIMDHDVIDGALEFASRSRELREAGERAPRVIVGEEVRSTGGEICGLFLSERIPDHLEPRKTMELIKEQGGLVYVPHPFDVFKLKRLKARELLEHEDLIDILESFNGKPRFPGANILARRFLARNHFPGGAGSDAHEPVHLGAASVELEEFSGPGDILEKLDRGRISGNMYSPFASAYIRVRLRKKMQRE